MPPQEPNPHHQRQHQPAGLPTPRTFLTSLLKSLSTATTTTSPARAPGPESEQKPEQKPSPQNPLPTLPTGQKSLLATLHVLFPPPTLLQALDLLDRGLVTRVRICPSPSSSSFLSSSPPGQDSARENTFYTVRSAQARSSSSSRYEKDFGSAAAMTGRVYVVRLRAWACDCAAFAFASFPPGGGEGGSASVADGDEDEDEDGDGDDVGGLSLDGKEGEGVPVCKHLLACLLAERCGNLFGEFVTEVRVGREEGAGICAG